MTTTKSYVQLQIEADLVLDPATDTIEKRKTRILAAATQECSENSFRKATIANFAQRASVSTATIYRYFKDKTDVFFHSVAYFMPIFAASVTRPIEADTPANTVCEMLVNHGKAFGDPFVAWLYRLYVSANEPDLNLDLSFMARAGRTLTESHWSAHLTSLEQSGLLTPSNHAVTINLLLGQIERRSVLALLLFGQNDDGEPSIEAAAKNATRALFANLGTTAFHDAYPDNQT